MSTTQLHAQSDAMGADKMSKGRAFSFSGEMPVFNPAASFLAMSALGFGLASHAFGLWAGTVAGAAQASQRLFAPLRSDEGAASTARSTEPVAFPKRPKPALRVVAKSEAVQPVAPAAEPEPAKPVAKPQPVKIEPQALMPEDFHKPRAIERPAAPDDLKAISGIGPKLEQVLNGLGVWTFAQIAAWEKQEIAWVDDYLSFKGRIDRDGWIAQAKSLASNEKNAG